MTRPELRPLTRSRVELIEKGYTKDRVLVECCCCHRRVECKWKRNTTPGINYGRPLIELPEDWKVIVTYGSTKQDVLCNTCDYEEFKEHMGIILP